MITYQCPHCNADLSIPDKYAGIRGKCNHCSKAITVPDPFAEDEEVALRESSVSRPETAPYPAQTTAIQPVSPVAPAQQIQQQPVQGQIVQDYGAITNKRGKVTNLRCQQCGGIMYRTSSVTGGCANYAGGLLTFTFGFFVLVILGALGVGLILGPLIMLASIPMMWRKDKMWRCRSCGCVIKRA